MSKRRVENKIDDVSDEILGDLEPERRLQLVLETKAEEKDQWAERLIESCPRENYRAPDHAFTDRMRFVQRLIELAVYELHTTYLQYKLTRQQQRYTWVLDYERDAEPSDEELDKAAQRADTIQELFAELYTNYYAYQRFAVEILDVDFEGLFVLHYEGPAVFEIVSEQIDDPQMIRIAESHLTELLNGEDETSGVDQATSTSEPVALEEIVELRYEGLVSVWEDAIAEIPS